MIGHRNYIEDGSGGVRAVELMAWARMFEEADRRVAAHRWFGIEISTVFLGLDHQFFDGPPILYETMIFTAGTFEDQGCWRYTTRAEAIEGHVQVLWFVMLRPLRRAWQWLRGEA